MAKPSCDRMNSTSSLGLRFRFQGLRNFSCIVVLLSFAILDVESKKDDHVIGIDLGTTYSCVGVYRNGQVEIVTNNQGSRITPSWVAFTEDGEQLVGEAAKNQVGNNPTNTLYDVKRIIGRAFDDPDAQKDIKSFPFTVKERSGKPVISIEYQGKTKSLMPEEVSAMILGEMKKIAEDFLGSKVSKAVVTVPAYFNDAQRQATKNAGKIAGLDILRIINEPTAAAIAYGMDKGGTMKNILVFDLGGGTFDVSLLTVNNGVFEVLATNGDTHLGGEDFDKRLVAYLAKQFEAKTGIALGKADKSAVARLRRECENAKRMLSTQVQVTVEVEDIKGGQDLRERLTRAKFEELNMDLFKKTLVPVQNVLKDAGMAKRQVHEVILVGGSTRIPKVRQLLKEFFNGKEPSAEVNPDEAVAFGATVQAGILTGQDFALMAGGSGFKDLVLIDVTPLTLGIETTGGIMTPVIDRNQAIPARKSKVFTTEVDNQANVFIQVYQGERQFVKDNSRLGGFTLGNIPPAPRGVPQIDVAFQLDANGILFVTAQDLGTKKKESISISNSMGRLSEDEIERMIRDAKKYADQDRKAKVRLEARQGLLTLMKSIEAAMKDEVGRAMDDADKAEVREAIENTRKWLRSKEGKKADADDLEDRKANIERLWKPLVTRAYQEGGGGSGGGGGGGGDDGEGEDRGGGVADPAARTAGLTSCSRVAPRPTPSSPTPAARGAGWLSRPRSRSAV